MIRISQCKCSIEDPRSLKQLAADFLRIPADSVRFVRIHRRSVDARKRGEISYVYTLDVATDRDPLLLRRLGRKGVTAVSDPVRIFPESGSTPLAHRPVVVGAGPAGLFAAYDLALHGYRPLLFERGWDVERRTRDVAAFWNGAPLDPRSNVQFGEGGAGTFSDGKLNTAVKDPAGRIRQVFQTFVDCGADPEILYDSHPHIGTDELAQVIRSLRGKILEAGGEIRFGCRVTDFLIRDGRLEALCYEESGADGTLKALEIPCEVCVLAVGHSARDTFALLKERGIPMEAKPFAVGFRVEHPQEMIQTCQYGASGHLLPPASYKVTARSADGRGVDSFCMCPGGRVVNASSEPGRLAVNGMSSHARDGRNANAAIVVAVQPEDFLLWSDPARWGEARAYAGTDPAGGTTRSDCLAGVTFQRILEERAYRAGQGRIPVQLFGDYLARRPSSGLGEVIPDTAGGYRLGDVREILPAQLGDAVAEGIRAFGRQIAGFDREDAVLSGVESRTSSPVRILRDEQMESAVKGLYPCGEGAGYAGGITSAAMDGMKAAEKIAARYARPL